MKRLLAIQRELKAPKSQYNSFGKYNYRNLEDILEAVKPLLVKHNVTLLIADVMIHVGDHNYVMAEAVLLDVESGNSITSVTATARESVSQKGMNDAQITGSTSSYARKYAVNGLFLIDDTKDSDTDEFKNETTGRAKKSPTVKEKNDTVKEVFSGAKLVVDLDKERAEAKKITDLEDLKTWFLNHPPEVQKELNGIKNDRKFEILDIPKSKDVPTAGIAGALATSKGLVDPKDIPTKESLKGKKLEELYEVAQKFDIMGYATKEYNTPAKCSKYILEQIKRMKPQTK